MLKQQNSRLLHKSVARANRFPRTKIKIFFPLCWSVQAYFPSMSNGNECIIVLHNPLQRDISYPYESLHCVLLIFVSRCCRPAVAPPPPVPALPKDFQDALDIIFPTDAKKTELATQDLFPTMPHVPGYTGILGPFPSLMPPMNHFMNPFDMNASLFPPRPQLYEAHVPVSVPSQNKRPNGNKKPYQNNRKQNYQNRNQKQSNPAQNNQSQTPSTPQETPTTKSQVDAQAEKEKNGQVSMKREELDDLAMLGIDASDVGAGI